MNGFVYFIAPEALLHRPEYDEGKVVKIGYTSQHPEKRLRSLQTGSPLHLKLWAYTEGSMELERAFHETFASSGCHGEWFFVHGKLWAMLAILGNEPNVGNFISYSQLGTVLFDTVFCDGSPHPSISDQQWLDSADPSCLSTFFPEEYAERYT